MKYFSLLNLFLVFALLLGALPAKTKAQGKSFRGTIRVIIAGPACSDTSPLRQSDFPGFDVYFSNSPELLNDSTYVAKALDWSSEPQLSNGQIVKYRASFPRSGYYRNDENNDYGVWAYDIRPSIRDLNLNFGDRLYYRFYSPHFINPIKGSVVLEDSEYSYPTVRIDDLLRCKCVKFTTPIDLDGKAVKAYLAPNRNTARSHVLYSVNMIKMPEYSDFGYMLFAQPGTKIEYAIEPDRRPELAMRTGDFIVGNSEIQTIETDYRNAVKCHLYVNDSKGKRCNVTNAKDIGSFYYESYPGTCTMGYGCLNMNIGSPSPGDLDNGTICMYAFPGKLGYQLWYPTVETDDPDFVMPYNTSTNYLMAKLYVAENVKEQNLVMGESKPLKVTTTLKNAAKYVGQITPTFRALYLWPYSGNTDPTFYETVTNRLVESKTVGNDLVLTSLVNNVEGKAVQKVDLNFKYPQYYNEQKNDTIATALACHGVNIDSHATELQLTEKNFAYDLNNKPLDFDKIATIRFIVPCRYFVNGNSLVLTNNKGLDIAIQHRKYCSNYNTGKFTQLVNADTIVCLLPGLEDSYAWFAKKRNASRPTNEAIIPIEFDNNRYAEIYPNLPGFSIKRMWDIDGVQLVFADNRQGEFIYQRECILTEAPTCEGGTEEKQAYIVKNIYPIEEGKNDYEIKYRQLKFNTAQPDSVYCYPGYISFNSHLTYGACQKYYISTDSHLWFGVGYPSKIIYDYNVQPSENDIMVYPNLNKMFKVNFVYNGEPLPDGELIEKDFEISYKYKDEKESPSVWCKLSDLLYESVPLTSGQYTMSGEIGVTYQDSTTGDKKTINIPLNNFKFEVKEAPLTVELNPVANAIDNVNASPSNATVVRRYTMDGRSITMPQRGVNLLKMSDGTIRKVIVK